MPQFIKKIYIVISALAIVSIAAPAAYSQPPQGGTAATDQVMRDQKRIERRMIAPPRQTPERAPKELVAPEEEGPKFLVKKINLIGCESVAASEFSKYLAEYEGKEVSMGDLNILARDIESEYLKRGFVTAVFVPPQDIKDNIVIMQVVEAKMGDLIIQKPKFFRTYLMKRWWQIKPGEVISYNKMSRSIQMMNKNPDREVKAALKAGTKPSTTDVILTSKSTFPIHFTMGFDNDGSIPSGKYRTSFGIRDNNFLGCEDTLVVGTMFGDHFNGKYGYHNIPISSFGTSFLYGGSTSYSNPKKDFDQYDMRSYAVNENGSIHQDLYSGADYLGEVFVGFDFKDKVVYANSGGPDSPNNAGTINKDRLRVLSIGGTYVKRTSDSVMYISPEYDQGIRIFGASPSGNPYASNDASSVYSKFLLAVNERSRLPLGIQSNLKIATQFAEEKLTPQEQYALGGINSVRGYPASDFSADSALLVSYELLIPAIVIPSKIEMPYSERTFKDWTTGVLFVDYGHGLQRGDRRAKDMTGVGMGVRFNVYDMATLRLEWAWPIGDKPLSSGEAGVARFHMALDFQDRIPDQIDTIIRMNKESAIKRKAAKLVEDELAKPDSEVRKRLAELKSQANKLKQEGKKEELAKVIAEIALIKRSLKLQSEDFVKSQYTYKDEIKENRRLAEKYTEEGKDKDAREALDKALTATPPKQPPFTLPK